jgi:hypothetical protein
VATRRASPELRTWAKEALDLGFGCFSDGDHNPFILFVAASGQHKLLDLQSTRGVISPDFLEAGRDIIRQFRPGQFYGLVWDGFLTMDGKRLDAVFAELGVGGEPLGYLFAQRYKQAKSGKLSRVRLPLFVAEITHLWEGSKRRRPRRRADAPSRSSRGRRPTGRR